MTDALGMVEVRGLASAVLAANLAVNTADVTVAGFGYLHDGRVAVTLRGAVDAVRAAVDAVTGRMPPGTVLADNVIARVAPDVEPVLRERAVPLGGKVGAPRVRGRGGVDRPPGPVTHAATGRAGRTDTGGGGRTDTGGTAGRAPRKR